MTSNKTRAVSGDAGLLAARNQTPAPAGSSAAAPNQPERAPVRCPTCGHVAIPAVYCANPECGHLEEFHDLARDRRTRKACSHHEGARNTPCGCKAFTPELTEGLPNA